MNNLCRPREYTNLTHGLHCHMVQVDGIQGYDKDQIALVILDL